MNEYAKDRKLSEAEARTEDDQEFQAVTQGTPESRKRALSHLTAQCIETIEQEEKDNE